jgi:hypothetical protein
LLQSSKLALRGCALGVMLMSGHEYIAKDEIRSMLDHNVHECGTLPIAATLFVRYRHPRKQQTSDNALSEVVWFRQECPRYVPTQPPCRISWLLTRHSEMAGRCHHQGRSTRLIKPFQSYDHRSKPKMSVQFSVPPRRKRYLTRHAEGHPIKMLPAPSSETHEFSQLW